MKIEELLAEKLELRKEKNLLRKLKHANNLIDFCSNDYLGLTQDNILKQKIEKAFKDIKNSKLGSGGSRLLSGNSQLVEKVEQQLAKTHQSESALIFNSGYAANLSIFSSIPQKNDTIIYDELSHACIKEGARLSFANRLSFKHNDITDLEKKLEKAKGTKFIAVESIYSMDGDESPIDEILDIAKIYDANVIVDEAHSTGLWGEKGGGFCVEKRVHDKVFARIHTFGKGIGAHGACIVGSDILKQYLINFARPFIFTTSLPDHNLITIQEAYKFIAKNPQRWISLKEKIKLFKSIVKVKSIQSNSPIQAILFPGNKNARKVSRLINNHGYDVRPILSPTVKAGVERIRVCIHDFNTNEDIIRLAKLINEL